MVLTMNKSFSVGFLGWDFSPIGEKRGDGGAVNIIEVFLSSYLVGWGFLFES